MSPIPTYISIGAVTLKWNKVFNEVAGNSNTCITQFLVQWNEEEHGNNAATAPTENESALPKSSALIFIRNICFISIASSCESLLFLVRAVC